MAESKKSLKRFKKIEKKFLTKPSSCANINKLLTEMRASKFDKKF